jgi:hypothetical protein
MTSTNKWIINYNLPWRRNEEIRKNWRKHLYLVASSLPSFGVWRVNEAVPWPTLVQVPSVLRNLEWPPEESSIFLCKTDDSEWHLPTVSMFLFESHRRRQWPKILETVLGLHYPSVEWTGLARSQNNNPPLRNKVENGSKWRIDLNACWSNMSCDNQGKKESMRNTPARPRTNTPMCFGTGRPN